MASVTENDTWPFTAEHPLMVSRKWNQQEMAFPSPVLGGDLTPIDVQREASGARRGCKRSFATPAQRKRWTKINVAAHRSLQPPSPGPWCERGGLATRMNPAQLLACQPARMPFGVLLSFLFRF